MDRKDVKELVSLKVSPVSEQWTKFSVSHPFFEIKARFGHADLFHEGGESILSSFYPLGSNSHLEGHGISGEVLNQILVHARDKLDINVVRVYVHDTNTAMAGLIKSRGFRREEKNSEFWILKNLKKREFKVHK